MSAGWGHPSLVVRETQHSLLKINNHHPPQSDDNDNDDDDCCCEQRLSTGRVTVATTRVLSTLMVAGISAWRTDGTPPAVGESWSCRYQGGEVSLLSYRESYSCDHQVQWHHRHQARILPTITVTTTTITILDIYHASVFLEILENLRLQFIV